MKTFIVVALLALAGCKDKAKDKPAEPAKTTEPAKTEPTPEAPKGDKVLELAAAKISGEANGKKEELAIDATGKVTMDGKEVATLTTAGELNQGGKVVATLSKDGKMSIVGEPDEQITIRPDGALIDKNGVVALEPKADGTFGGPMTKGEMQSSKMKIEGDKAGYRALMFAWLGVSKSPSP
jgi:hypothetical protein